MHSACFSSTFLRVFKFLQIKVGGPNFWGEPILHKVWIIWSRLLFFNFKNLMERNSSSLIRFQCIVHHLELLFSEPWNFYKLKRGDLISGANQFAEYLNYLVPPSVFQVLWSQTLHHSLDFNAFCMMQEYFSQSLEMSTN